MRKQLAKGFVAYMTPERKPRGYRFNYGIGVTNTSPDATTIFLTFTFRNGHRYCCPASGCHHGLLFDSDYQRLRDCFRQAGVDVPWPMKIHMRVVYERGALFAVNPGESQPTYEAVIEGRASEEIYDESKAVPVLPSSVK